MNEYIVRMPNDMPYEIKAELNAWYVNDGPIVRCRDCRYYTPQDGIIWPECLWFGVAFRDDDDSGFCKWGEPK